MADTINTIRSENRDANEDEYEATVERQPAEPNGRRLADLEAIVARGKRLPESSPLEYYSPILDMVFLFRPLTKAQRDAAIADATGRSGNVNNRLLEFFAVNKATQHPTKVTKRMWDALAEQEAGICQGLFNAIAEASGMTPTAEEDAKNGSTPEGES